MILSPFFLLTDIGAHTEARLVLKELLRLIPESHSRAELFRGRLFHEKLAYSLAKENRFEDAREPYLEAAKHCGNDLRGELKVRGGAAISGYIALRRTKNGDVEHGTVLYITEMDEVAAGAREHGFPDVLETAESNIELMKAGRSENWYPFET